MRRNRVLSTIVLLLAVPLAAAAPSREPPPVASPVSDRFYIRGIYFQPSLTTDARFDSDLGTAGTEFNGETDLALDDVADQGRMELMFRMRERHKLRVDYFKLERDGNTVLTEPIAFRNDLYNTGDRVESSIDWRMLGFTYTWSALRAERYELGLGLGLHLIEAEARATVRARNIRESGSGVGVLPTLAIDAAYRISKRWSVTGRAQYLSVGVSDVDGSFADFHVDAQYRWRRNLTLGLGYSAINFDADITGNDLPGAFALDASGPEVFFRFSF